MWIGQLDNDFIVKTLSQALTIELKHWPLSFQHFLDP